MDIHAYIQSGIIESYLLGIAGDEEGQELNRLRRIYPEVESAIHSAEEWLYGIASPAATPVPEKIRAQILASIDAQIELPEPVKKIKSSNGFYRYSAAASLVLFIPSFIMNLVQYNKYQEEKNKVLALQEQQQALLVQNQAIQAKMIIVGNDLKMVVKSGVSRIVMNAVPGRGNFQSTLLMDDSGKELLLVSNSLPAAPEGKQYQLWAIVNGKAVNAGLLEDCEPYCKFNTIANAQAYAVTLEQTGGSVNPTADQMFVFGKVSS